ncbi:MAG: DUF937 domain-containing protein [Hyphomicrobiaceae bacterium]|nr:DUF937 domain-containing protein [Hyphomicrobiaceae bacterium]
MQVLAVIESAQSGQVMANLASTLGVGEDQVRAAADAVLPELALAIERNTLSRGGLADLVRALGDGHHEAVLDSPRGWSDPHVAADGNAIVVHILGSEHKARAIAAKAQRASGLSGGIIEALLPILAQLLMGALSRYMKGGLGDILSRLPIPGGNASGEPGERAPRRETGRWPREEASGGFELPRVEIPPGGGFPLPPMPPSDSPSPPRDSEPGGGFGLPWPGSRRGGEDTRSRQEEQEPGGGFELPKVDLPPAGGYPLPPMPPSEDDNREPTPRSDGRDGHTPRLPLPGPSADNPAATCPTFFAAIAAASPRERTATSGASSGMRSAAHSASATAVSSAGWSASS